MEVQLGQDCERKPLAIQSSHQQQATDHLSGAQKLSNQMRRISRLETAAVIRLVHR
jgi:hypothetical protein